MLPDMEGREDFENMLQHYVDQVIQYHDPEKQELARALLPLDELHEKAAIALAKEGNFDPSKIELEHFVLLQLLFWFKTAFRWVNSPPCDFCSSKTHHIGMGVSTAEELQFGAGRIEIFSCELCGTCTRFPRYNDPVKLMETQSGRCGEWANCFTFYCIALGYDARLVIDFTDHVWTECYSPYLERWMHMDPCEAAYDKPLLYEKGWGKKLSYTIAVAKHGVYDVTKRYTQKWPEVLCRRAITSEADVEEVLALLTAVQRSRLAPEEFELLEERDKQELQELSQLELKPVQEDASLPGRISGSKEWRAARGEMGAQMISEKSFFCPPRQCVDEHVGKIYEALGQILSEGGVDEVAKKLRILHEILIKLKREPFKTRKLNLAIQDAYVHAAHTKGTGLFFSAIGLDLTNSSDGVTLCLKDKPGRVALALAVAVENLERIAEKCLCYRSLKESPFRLMMEGRRIFGAVVYATGEEAPLGLANAAFDGLFSTKWEEPDGAEGAWMVYQLPDNASRQLIGYDLTSANDCPERDPMNWVLESSNDSGETWSTMDKRIDEYFEERFQRKSFNISQNLDVSFNVLRFHFLSAKITESNSRLQIACIDFYTRAENA